jgi:uncharacterized protein (TIGR00730 family)
MPIKKLFKRKNRSSLKLVAKQERIHAREITERDVNRRMKRINKEFKQAFKVLMTHPDTVTFFGSARFEEDNRYYQLARELSKKIVEELGSAIVSGGGGGIMEAANRGAKEAHGESIGMTIKLPREQVTNKYVNYSVDFYYFFSRKVALAFTARAYVYFPGGFGTLDEFFEILTLKQTGRIDPIPVILVGSDFWGPLQEYIDSVILKNFEAISPNDEKLYYVTDDLDEVVRIISQPLTRNYK